MHRITVRLARRMAVLAVALPLAACVGGGDETYYARPKNTEVPQPFPANYRAELLAFMRTYLNDPTNIRQAAIAEPALREIGGYRRYYVCLRYDARDSGGRYTGVSDRAALYLDGRFDRLLERQTELCGTAAYAPFAELERLTR